MQPDRPRSAIQTAPRAAAQYSEIDGCVRPRGLRAMNAHLTRRSYLQHQPAASATPHPKFLQRFLPEVYGARYSRSVLSYDASPAQATPGDLLCHSESMVEHSGLRTWKAPYTLEAFCAEPALTRRL